MFPLKVNSFCAFKCEFQKEKLIYQVTWLVCGAIYIGNTKHTLKKCKGGIFYDFQTLLKTGQKLDSYIARYKQNFKYTMPHANLHI